MSNHLEKFTSRCSKVLEDSKARACVLGKKEVGVEDLFWSLVGAKGSMAREILNKSGFDKVGYQSSQLLNEPIKKIENGVKEKTFRSFDQTHLSALSFETRPKGDHFKLIEGQQAERQPDKKVILSSLVKRAIERSVSLAAELGHPYVGTEHLLFALLDIKHEELDKILITYKVDRKKIIEQLKIVFQATLNFGEMANIMHQVGEAIMSGSMSESELLKSDLLNHEINGTEETSLPQAPFFKEKPIKRGLRVREKGEDKRAKRKMLLLEYFGRNLCDEKNQRTIDPVIGREAEIERIIQILARRTKNNPVLLGDPGVGKTAIVEGLAKKIIQADVPDMLLNKKIYSLDINLMVAGAMMRGEFEARLKQVLNEVKNNPDTIIFIDELHNVVGAGAVGGAMDAANILKPALARGELRCIGATTYEEYKKHIEEDAALERRFQPVQVAEPSLEEAIEILQGIKENYEKHHWVKITNEAIEAAVDLSVRYLPEKFLPDKAIDLIDEAAARIKVKAGVVDEDLRQRKLLAAKIEEINLQKQEQVRQENYPAALKLKQEETKLFDQLFALEDKVFNKEDRWLGKVKAQDVAQVVSEITKVPLENLVTSAKNKILNLEKILAKKIIGQDEVLKELAFYLKRARAGLAGQARPLGSFMFLGPTGVGKTETAKVLAEEIFASHDKKGALIRLDMSEFAEGFNISRLIGSPAGYVGYKEGGRLTEAVRRNPYSVVLFDEIEKAHPEVFNVLLQILDNGTLTDATGKKVNFKNTIIILTSNLGTEKLVQSDMGFGGESRGVHRPDFIRTRDRLEKQVKETFSPEFLNRLDKILIFKPLSLKSVEKIVGLRLSELAGTLKKNKKIKLNWSKEIVKKLAKLAYSPENGARDVRRLIEGKVENELADKILNSEIKTGQEVKISWEKNGVEFRLGEIRN